MKLKSILALLLALGLLLAGCKTKSEPAASEKPSTVPSKTDAATGETKAFSMDDVKAEIDSKSVSDFTESSEPTDYVKLTIADYGELVLRLRPDIAPISVENFKGLVAKGYYDGKLFHRVYPGFMIQGGSENGDGLPGSEPSIKGEFASNGVENPLSHVRGVLSMARATPPDSGSTQFFLMHADYIGLDGNYAAFGYVVAGLDTVDQVCKVELTYNGSELSQPVTPVVLTSAVFVTPNQ